MADFLSDEDVRKVNLVEFLEEEWPNVTAPSDEELKGMSEEDIRKWFSEGEKETGVQDEVKKGPSLAARATGDASSSGAELIRKQGEAEERRGRLDAAEVLYTSAADKCKTDIRPLESRASLMIRKGHARKALADAEEVLRLRSGRAQALKIRGEALLKLGRYGEARASFSSAVKGTCVDKTTLREAREGIQKATEMEESVRRSDSKWDAEKELGNVAYREGRLNDALAHYGRALAVAQNAGAGKECAAILSNRSAVGCRMGSIESLQQAERDARRCVELRPDWVKGLSRLGAARLLLKDLDGAETSFNEGLLLDPTNAACASGLVQVREKRKSNDSKSHADACFKSGKYHDAIEAYSRALKEAKNSGNESEAILCSNRSAAYAKIGEWDKALKDGQRAVALRPNWSRAFSRVGGALHGQNNPEMAYIEFCKGLSQCPGTSELLQARMSAFESICRGQTRLANWRENKNYARSADMPANQTRIFCVSDIHVDQHGNISWCHRISSTKFQNDVLLVAGDVGDTYEAVRQALRALKQKFRRVFWMPGNHEMWVRQDTRDKDRFEDSICKLIGLQLLCDDLGCETGPAEVAEGLFIVPLYSWYNYEFDICDPRPGSLRYDRFCKWPANDMDIWKYFLALNGLRVARKYKRCPDHRVLTFSHFLPRPELPCPPVQELIKAVGCQELDKQVRDVEADVHVYGHTHINGDGPCGPPLSKSSEAVRYVQSALEGGATDLYCIWNRGHLSGTYINPF